MVWEKTVVPPETRIPVRSHALDILRKGEHEARATLELAAGQMPTRDLSLHYGLSEQGLRFTTILLVFGFCVVTYAAAQIGPMILNERRAQEWLMKREIKKLSDHYIVCGFGRVGRARRGR